MDRRRFRRLVREAIDTLPVEFRQRLLNVEVVVEDEPSDGQLEDAGVEDGDDTLYGLYEGTPLAEREHNFGMALPDRITIFYLPLVEDFRSPNDVREQVRLTIIHEVAHFFGMDEDEIEDLGY